MTGFYLRGISLLVGMIIGAGIFALPYIFSRAGLFWGLFHFALAFLILLFLHLLYGEIAYFTEGRHRFTGYLEKFLGQRAKGLGFLVTMASYYASLLVYGLLGGIFLSNIFTNFSPFFITLTLFLVSALLALFGINKIASINFYLIIPLFGFIIYLIFIAYPLININNFNLFGPDWFLPYGAWLFALAGFSVIPEIRDVFFRKPLKSFKKTIFWGVTLSAIFSLLFVLAVFGVGGKATTQDALSGLSSLLGPAALLAGSIIGFLAVFTSYLVLAIDLREIFRFDYKISFLPAWLLTFIPPIILFLLGVSDFVRIISLTGALGMGVLGVFIILMARKLREKIGESREPLLLNPVLENFILIAVLLGVAYELWRIFA